MLVLVMSLLALLLLVLLVLLFGTSGDGGILFGEDAYDTGGDWG